ncbi:MAG: hypothetical protein HUU54_06295 [Ignavibacteriaceae bacterium]|nr:hypothetical protein [Ignavibacteriaceae bacterium]
MKKILSLLSIVLVLFFAGCEDRSELTAPSTTVNTGTADFSSFASIGNSITAGYQSGSLYNSAQMYAFGNLIAKQVGATYAYPNYSDPGTPGRIEIVNITATGLVTRTNTTAGTPTNTTYPKPYNNLGVPGALLYDVVNATSSANSAQALASGGLSTNPLFDLILRGQGSMYKQAQLQAAKVITLWIGNNDVLGYATSGGTSPAAPTSSLTFGGLYSQMADSIASIGAKVVVGNIPDVTTIPFFTTVGGQLLLAGTTRVWGVGSNGDTLLMSLTQNLLTLKATAELYTATGAPSGKGFARSLPLSSSVILDSAEIMVAKNATDAFNGYISTIASAKGWGLVDINAIFKTFEYNPPAGKTGVTIDGIKFSAQFVLGNLFSLDGVHPSNQGHAIVANEFIKVINSKWSASIPLINVATIPGGLPFAKSIQRSNIGIPLFPKGAFDNLLF